MSGDYKPRYLYEATYAQTCDCAYDRVAVRAKHAIKRKKSKKRRILRAACIVTAALAAALVYFQTNVTRVLISVSEAAMRSAAVEAHWVPNKKRNRPILWMAGTPETTI